MYKKEIYLVIFQHCFRESHCHTHKEFKVSGADQAVASVVTWSTDHQQRRSGFDQGGNWIRLQEKKTERKDL